MQKGITLERLTALLSNCPEYESKAVKMMQQHRPTPQQPFPAGVSRQDYFDAALQSIEYTRECGKLAERLRDLPSVSMTVPTLDYMP